MIRLDALLFPLTLTILLFANQVLAATYVVAVNAGVADHIDVVDGGLVGARAPIYQCVFDLAGEDFRYTVMPLKRSLYELDKGGVDITLPLVWESSRDRYGDFGGDLFFADYVYLSIRELPPISRDSGLTYVMLRSFAGLTVLLEDKDAEVKFVNLWEQAPAMLKEGRADAVLIPAGLVAGFMEDYEGTYYQQEAGRLGVSFYVAKKHSKDGLTAKLRDAVNECRRQFS